MPVVLAVVLVPLKTNVSPVRVTACNVLQLDAQSVQRAIPQTTRESVLFAHMAVNLAINLTPVTNALLDSLIWQRLENVPLATKTVRIATPLKVV